MACAFSGRLGELCGARRFDIRLFYYEYLANDSLGDSLCCLNENAALLRPRCLVSSNRKHYDAAVVLSLMIS